jgi:cytochrome c553
MKRAVSIRLSLQAALLAVLLPSAVPADAGGASAPGFEAKLSFCEDCHGQEGRGYLGWYPMPRLAGQQPEYIENQLKAFVTGNRENNVAILMSRVHNLPPSLGRALAGHFERLNPPPFGGAPDGGLAERGRRIFEEGEPESNVPACGVCHGPQAQGSGLNPSLAGQLYPYVVKELAEWRTARAQQYPSETVAIMTPIASGLSKQQIKSVAAYVSSIWPGHGRHEVAAANPPGCFPCVSSLPAGEALVIGERLAGRNCAWCHGATGHGYATAPQLAGQQPAYLENQLHSLHDRIRNNPYSQAYMWCAAADLHAETAGELATFYSSAEPKPACDGNELLVEAGRKLYAEGIPEENVVPCVACHGPEAQGVRDIPRLSGLSYLYLKRRLVQWSEGFDASAKPPMPRIASKLSEAQIEAVASYLSFAH